MCIKKNGYSNVKFINILTKWNNLNMIVKWRNNIGLFVAKTWNLLLLKNNIFLFFFNYEMELFVLARKLRSLSQFIIFLPISHHSMFGAARWSETRLVSKLSWRNKGWDYPVIVRCKCCCNNLVLDSSCISCWYNMLV